MEKINDDMAIFLHTKGDNPMDKGCRLELG